MKKTLSCDLCDETAEGETFEEWMQALFPHYAKAHPEVMSNQANGEAERARWMAENQARFDAA